MGQYVGDKDGKLSFHEGILVEAVRKGYWIVLDELNLGIATLRFYSNALAPSEVLEALNRLLDDNRELFIPETQQVVKPHPEFMLFATQNPPGLYGGRKVLSRAFRNRFLEIHFEDIPDDELEEILFQRYLGLLVKCINFQVLITPKMVVPFDRHNERFTAPTPELEAFRRKTRFHYS